MKKRKILFLTSQLPYAPLSGGLIKTYKMIEWLSKHYEVDVVSLLKYDDEKYINLFKTNLSKVKKLEAFKVDDEKRSVKNLFLSYLKMKPLNIIRNYSLQLKKYIYNLDVNKYDVIIVDHYVMFQYLNYNNSFKDKKILLHQHNAEYVMWERFAKKMSFFDIKKYIVSLEAKRIKKYEKNICDISDYVLCVSSNDIENLSKLGINRKKLKLVLSVGDDYLLKLPPLKFEKTQKNLLYIGTLSWEANIQGLEWFLANVWNKLEKWDKELKFYIIGKNPPKKLLRFGNERIKFLGFVDNLDEYYKKSRVFISPLFFGSGIKIKNINAMYRGLPIVTTSIGAEGIDGKDGEHFFICDNEKCFEEKIKHLIEDKEIWYKISNNSRELMIYKYTWEESFKILKEVIEND